MGRFHETGVSAGGGTYPELTEGGSVEGVTRMLAVGLGLDEGTFLDAGKYG